MMSSPTATLRRVLPQGGSLPSPEWERRHRVIVALLWVVVTVVAAYAVLAHGARAPRYLPEVASMMAFGLLASPRVESRKWRAVAASLALLTGAAALVDISGGLIEMHFAFFVVVVLLTIYEDWLPFLLAVAFVLLHHGIIGTLDPRIVFNRPQEWANPWAWAALHAMFVALAGVAGVAAWRLNEQVRDGMRAAQAELARIGETDALTGLSNRRRLMADLAAACEAGDDWMLAIFDLNGFKAYNDRFGHPAGDSLLARLAMRLQASVAGSGHAYRLGGDEFCVLAAGIGGEEGGVLVARWAEAFVERGDGFAISAASGTALIPSDAAAPSSALRICDRRMYASKNGGRSTAASQTRDVLLAALAARNSELGAHLDGVAAFADRLAQALGVSVEERQQISYAAKLHDIGKVAIPDSIIGKPGPLDEEEWEFMRRHTVIGERILSAAPALSRVGEIVRATHERYDGGGYPDRLRGEQIPLAARIIAVCDAYDAMTTQRPYRAAVGHGAAIAELKRCAGSQFDPLVVAAFAAAARTEAPAAHSPRPAIATR